MTLRALFLVAASAFASDLPPGLPALPHTAPPGAWAPLNLPRDAYLDPIEALCRFAVRHQDSRGAIIDPILQREHQYSTPYFSHAVGTLLHAGRGNLTAMLAHGYDGPFSDEMWRFVEPR